MRRLLPCVVLLASACGGFGDNKSLADGGSPAHDASAAADAAFCATDVTVSPQGAVAPVMLTATAGSSGSASPSWSVVGPSGAAVPFTVLNSSGLQISVEATEPGTYDFQVTFESGEACPGYATAVVAQAGARTQAYRLRVTPPGSSALPQQDVLVEVAGNTPQTGFTIALASGSTLTGALTGPSGPLAGQVALAAQSGPPVLAAFGANGTFAVPFRLDGTYTLLLQPLDQTVAPHLIGPIDGATLSTSSFAVGAGVTLSGVVRDASLQPLPGANVVVHSGLRPSSLGVADGTGSYSLHVEPGTGSLVVSAAGWPDVTLDSVAIAAATTIGVDEQAARLAVVLKVVRSDGTTPIASAHLSMRSSTIANAAIVHTPGGDLPASGRMHLELVTAADGTVSAQLPASAYDVLVDPGALSGSTDGITGLHVGIAAAGAVTLAVAPAVVLSGVVLGADGAGASGVRVRATPLAGSAIVGTTAGDGSFSLAGLGAGLPVALEVAPPATAMLAGLTQQLGDPMTLGAALPSGVTVSLSHGVELAGAVVTPGGAGLPGAAIDVLCATCGDPTPLFHADTTANGAYTLYVPDPGVVSPPDAGPGLE